MARPLLDRLPGVPRWVVGDEGYSAESLRAMVWEMGARPAIPHRRDQAPERCPEFICVNRNVVERLWGRLKEWRAVATRYDKTACSLLGVLHLAATLDRLKP